MKNTISSILILSAFAVSILTSSCESMMGNFLQKPPGGDVTEDTIFSSRTQVETFLRSIYQTGIHSNWGYATIGSATNYPNSDENIFAGACDEAETCAGWYRMNWWNEGSISANRTDDSRFSHRFMAIRKITVLLDRIDDVPDMTQEERDRMKGEARVIRALNYFEMMKRYGGMPIIKERLQLSDDLNIPRSNLKEMVNFILRDIDESYPHLADNMAGELRGRIHKGVALALKSKVLLFVASPLFNTDTPYLDFGIHNDLICMNEPENKVWWERAAAVADSCLQWAEANGYHLITGNPDADYQYSWEVYDNPEIILAEKFSGPRGCWNRPWSGVIPHSIIAGSSGKNGTTPLLNFVRKYEDRQGNKVDWNGGDDLQAKMASLDRRFSQTITGNMAFWNTQHPTVELWQAGEEGSGIAAGKHLEDCFGGFWLHKPVSPSIMRPENQEPIPNSTLFQLNEIYLNFAEAMNEAYGPDDNHGYRYSARQAINIIRDRAGQPRIESGSGIYSDFQALVRNERAIELAFDNHRFWDIRRWMIAEEDGVMSGRMEGIKIYWIDASPAEFRYTPYLYEMRTFTRKMYLHPFSTNEVNKGYLVQNPGY